MNMETITVKIEELEKGDKLPGGGTVRYIENGNLYASLPCNKHAYASQSIAYLKDTCGPTITVQREAKRLEPFSGVIVEWGTGKRQVLMDVDEHYPDALTSVAVWWKCYPEGTEPTVEVPEFARMWAKRWKCEARVDGGTETADWILGLPTAKPARPRVTAKVRQAMEVIAYLPKTYLRSQTDQERVFMDWLRANCDGPDGEPLGGE
jgi:hypothetical protein